MGSVFLKYYKIPFLISITLAIVLLALNVSRSPFEIAGVIIGCFIGIFVHDIEYLIYAYIMEPHQDFSRTLTAFIGHRDIGNALNYINFNSGEIKEKTLNSALFQIAIAMLSIFVVSSNTAVLVKALVLSVFANSIFKFSEYFFNDKLNEWFWALKEKPGRSGALIYIIVIILIFLYCLYIY